MKLLDPEEQAKLTNLDSFTGNPKSNDVLLYALPVCAPYTVLAKYKYKVKLTPGKMKKGKASKAALMIMTNSKEATENERTLLKAVEDNEMVLQMIGNCRIATAAGKGQGKGKNKKKKGGKKKAKK